MSRYDDWTLSTSFNDIDARLSKLEAEAAQEKAWAKNVAQIHSAARKASVADAKPKFAPAPETREPGWYWVKWQHGNHWQFGHLSADKNWRSVTSIGPKDHPVVIGPRIQEPGE